MKSKRSIIPWAAAWAWFSITVWTGAPVLLMWLFLPKQTEATYWVTGLLGLNLLSFYCFSWMAADPRGGWRLWWERERREGSSNAAIAGLVFTLALLWAFIGVFIARLSWKERNRLTDQLNQEDSRWLRTHGNHA